MAVKMITLINMLVNAENLCDANLAAVSAQSGTVSTGVQNYAVAKSHSGKYYFHNKVYRGPSPLIAILGELHNTLDECIRWGIAQGLKVYIDDSLLTVGKEFDV